MSLRFKDLSENITPKNSTRYHFFLARTYFYPPRSLTGICFLDPACRKGPSSSNWPQMKAFRSGQSWDCSCFFVLFFMFKVYFVFSNHMYLFESLLSNSMKFKFALRPIEVAPVFVQALRQKWSRIIRFLPRSIATAPCGYLQVVPLL